MAKPRKPWPTHKRRPWNRPAPGAESGPVLSWKKKRAEALLRWGGLCENCGVRAAKGFTTRLTRGSEESFSLIYPPLCSECHRAEHPEASPRDRGKEPTSMVGRARSTQRSDDTA